MKNCWTFVLGIMWVVLTALVMSLLPTGCAAAAEPPAVASSLLPARVWKAAQDRVVAGEYPAVVIGVVNGGKSRVYGFGKLANGKTPDAATVFEIGSITKTFTALLLADAVKKRSVALGEPVAKLLPGFVIPSRDGKQITLENLADQHSGLPRLPTNFDPANPADPYAGYDADRLKAFLGSYDLPRDPGSAYEYSNLGFGLLGYALARHADMTYDALVDERILQPLGMKMSGVAMNDATRAQLAAGHDATEKSAANWDFGVLAGAGALKSDGADMLRYLEANMGVLKTPLYAAMRLAQEPLLPANGKERVGLAWMTLPTKGGDVIWHNGMTGGYASFIGFTADGKRGVVILTNVQRPVDDLGFATLLADWSLAPAEKVISLPASALDDYAGSYRLATKFVLTISLQGDQLYARATGQGAFPIFPSAKDEFFARMSGIRISFERNAQGKIAGLVLHQNGDRRAPRISAAQAAAAATSTPIVTLPAATLREYAGQYRLAPGAVFDVTLAGDQLSVQLSGQPAFPVYASAKDKFFYTVVDARIEFVRDGEGNVVALVLHQNGQARRAPRVQR
ncbi:MAG TPA: serine hydrolase [Gammaproteobacteria bacterium]|nr:serine hydrolase [Gammaproteobacteria bacterium]